ncbi:MAG: ROK family protein [Pirellulales bacterium]
MFLGIEIGGTKLQLAIGAGDGSPLVSLERLDVEPKLGAVGIRAQIEQTGKLLIDRYGVRAIGIGFGGPVDTVAGVIAKSHQIEGWEGFPLVDWFRRTFGLPVVLGNDADTAGLAEARFGAGQGSRVVFYITVGSGIGGGLVIGGEVYRGNGSGAAEIGHLRPGPEATGRDQTIESIASGWGLARQAQARFAQEANPTDAADLIRRYGRIDQITGKAVAEAAAEGNAFAAAILARAWRTLGWGIAQVITLLAPDVVVIGGGVSLLGEEAFLAPVRNEIDRYVFPPFAGTFRIVPAQLGEEVVVHGALALAAGAVRE